MKSYNNSFPLDYYDELEKKEKEIYNELFYDEDSVRLLEKIDIKNICMRDSIIFSDYDYNLPQNIFIIKMKKGKNIVGRKIRSVLRIENKINSINCSMITSPMLLGFLEKRSKKSRQIIIEYYPFTNEEKKYIFKKLIGDRASDIYYPYKYRDFYSNKEEQSPDTGWSFNPDKKEYLGFGEKHLRKFTLEFFKNIDMDKKIIYDPACSTGEFLASLKKEYPKCYTIGHDLSQEMINYAKNYVDESCCCNALNTPLKESSVDIIFLRFLNSEVVSMRDAYKILKVLLPKVRKAGLVVCFGHTPVLIRKEQFEKLGLKCIICNGYNKEKNALFQYYIFEVK